MHQKKMKSNQIPDEDEFETVIYYGPGEPYILVDSQPETRKNIDKNVKLQPMDVRLALATAQYDCLLTPEFFKKTSVTSSSSSSRDGMSSSENPSNMYTPPKVSTSTINQRMVMPFSFPEITISSEADSEDKAVPFIDKVIHDLERVEILDEDPGEVDESEWVEWPKPFLEQNGFCLGIQPGHFYKNRSRPCFYVKLPRRSNYEILVTNKNQIPCDLDLYVNGTLANALRLPAVSSRSIYGPASSKCAFKIFRSKDAPKCKKVIEGDGHNGVVKAVFTPKKVGSSRLRVISEPLNDGDIVERSLDMSQVVEGVAQQQEKKIKKRYVPTPPMETDSIKSVVLQLRLIASLLEKMDATEDDVHDPSRTSSTSSKIGFEIND